MLGYLRNNGEKGIRNVLLVVYTVECSHHVAREIASEFKDKEVHVIGFGGCAPNEYANNMLKTLCTHANVGAVLFVSLGCENLDISGISAAVKSSGRPVTTLTIQSTGGTLKTIDKGVAWVKEAYAAMQAVPRVELQLQELIVGTICGGSDATSGISANPAIGKAFDKLIADGATAIFEETGELIGCEYIMAGRAASKALAEQLIQVVDKADIYYKKMGHDSFSAGNATGGLSTIEEKSMGAYSKSGDAVISGIIKPTERPPQPGLFLLDVVPDGEPLFGFPNINDNAEIAELISCGAHIILFSTGRGSVVGSAISPVIKICGNPKTFRMLQEDMDVDAGKIISGEATLDEVGEEILDCIRNTANGEPTRSEALRHREFVLTYKQFDKQQPGCFPG
ncbi:UxaA family hydrolase [Pontibacter beigongshangensis]|uniref:UxaA family hydrolase n=1 Tax=Pontibacter beigongshangensis TaxID=2574733 RepID=UPI0016507F52|nr:UxaA family hydrolase [Pontibacter beigongshangensis]